MSQTDAHTTCAEQSQNVQRYAKEDTALLLAAIFWNQISKMFHIYKFF